MTDDEMRRPDQERMEPSPKVEAKKGYQPPDYIVETYTDEEGLNATILTMLPGFFRYGYLILSALLLVMGVYMLLPPAFPFTAALSLIIGAACIAFRAWLPGKTVKRQIQQIQATYGTDKVTFSMIFWPQGIAMTNKLSGDEYNIRYEEFKAISRRGDYLALKTRAGKSIVIRMEDVKGDALPEYLTRKCPTAKLSGIKRNVSRETSKKE